MSHWRRRLSAAAGRLPALLAGALLTAALASIVQTQVNLAAMGLAAPGSIRLAVTLEDLARFGPVMMAIALAALAPAFAVAHFVGRWMPGPPRALRLAAAGAAGILVAFVAMPLVTPMPALVMAARTVPGLLLLAATGAPGGWLYAGLTDRPIARPGYRTAILTGLLIGLPAASFALTTPAADPPVPRADPAGYRVETVLTGLDRPWSLAFLPDGRTLVTLMGGRLLTVSADGSRGEIALAGLPPFARGGENGLLEVAVDPQFPRNRFLYLTMIYGEPGASGTRAVRVRLDGDRIAEPRVLFSSTVKRSTSNNGGRMAFLSDGTIALTVGDANDRREDAQAPGNTIGKVVRFDREGGIPRDNPFVGRPGFAPAIFTLGHRNPQGIARDPATGALLLSDHGPRGGDELNRLRPGGNYGWPRATGGIDYSFARVTPYRRLAGTIGPLLEWTPSIAPAGLAVYDGRLFAGWRGDLLIPALKERAVRRVIRAHGRIIGQQLLLAERGERIRDVRGAPDGSILVLTDGPRAALLRLVPALASPN